jgi:FixJ family two-component response regulator/DNA-binding winged helix-turn-helix (wHTH) protein
MIQLGNASVFLERREVFVNGQPLRLGGRAFDVLAQLLEAPGRLVTKDELLERVWPNLVVEENNLQVHICNLRKTLGLGPEVIETVPRQGYRLNLMPPTLPPKPALTPPTQATAHPALATSTPVVHIVDDDPAVCAAVRRLLRAEGLESVSHGDAASFLAQLEPSRPSCLLLDVNLRHGTGFDVQDALVARGGGVPIIFMTGYGTIAMSVKAMKAGAEEFLTKPFDDELLLGAVRKAVDQARQGHARLQRQAQLEQRLATLTARERQVLELLIQGHQSKQVAALLGTQEVTVKVHKKHVMAKMRARTLVELVNLCTMLGMVPDVAELAPD